MDILFWIAVSASALFVLDRGLLKAEERGFLYYRKTKASPGALGSALARIQSVLEPDKAHVADVQQRQEIQEEPAGAPPAPCRRTLEVRDPVPDSRLEGVHQRR
ncbi:MAG: hypothetical protein NVS2B9_04350 [Myxococcales bacterium]